MHTIDVEPTPTPPRRTPRSTLWLWTAAIVVIAVVAVVAVLWWPNGVSGGPPWGLDQVDMPNTEAEVTAVLQALPAIDGRLPSFSNEDGWVFATYYGSEAAEGRVAISAMYDPGLRDAFPEWNVEESAVDSASDLLWMTPFADEGDFGMMWAASDGSWLFILEANTADLRTKLIHAFIEATNQ